MKQIVAISLQQAQELKTAADKNPSCRTEFIAGNLAIPLAEALVADGFEVDGSMYFKDDAGETHCKTQGMKFRLVKVSRLGSREVPMIVSIMDCGNVVFLNTDPKPYLARVRS